MKKTIESKWIEVDVPGFGIVKRPHVVDKYKLKTWSLKTVPETVTPGVTVTDVDAELTANDEDKIKKNKDFKIKENP